MISMKVGIGRIARIILGSLLFFTCATFIYRPGKATTPSHTSEGEKRLNVIFDLGGVIFDTHKTRTFWHLGPKALFYYWHGNRKNVKTIRSIFYTALNNISQATTNQYGAQDDEEHPLPQLLCDWLTGNKTPRELRKLVFNEIKQHSEWFESKAEKQLALRTAKIVFTPEIFAHTRRLIGETVDLIKECKEKGHRVFILSNWDAESFALLRQKYANIFSLFDGIIISGHVHDLKPNQSIYKHLTNTLPPETCVLIDDQKENLETAKRCGMHAILCKKKPGILGSELNIDSMRRKLGRIEKNIVEIPLAKPEPQLSTPSP